MFELLDPVADIIRGVAAEVIDPRFRTLAADEVIEKSPGDLVTIADREAEAALEARLAELLPGVVMVGEESAAADPSRVELIASEPMVWVVDPIDGTGNFVRGSADHAVMVALVQERRTVASWIWHPQYRTMLSAARGHGVFRNGVRLDALQPPATASGLAGVVKTGFAPDAIAAALARRRAGFERVGPGRACAGVEYADVVAGREDFLLYWVAYPWDHAPGILMITELGGHAAHLDGAPYDAASTQSGLLVAASETAWNAARTQLFG